MTDAQIEFSAIVYKAQTLIDGGLRITLDLPETAIPQAAMLMECKREGIPLIFIAVPDIQEGNRRGRKTNSVETGSKRKSTWTTAGSESVN